MASGQLTAEGSTAAMVLPQGTGTVKLTGDFGGGTVSLQVQTSGGAWLDFADNAFSSEQVVAVDFGAWTRVRLTLAGATSPELDWEITYGATSPVRVA